MQVDSVSCNGTPRGQGFFFSFKDFVYLFLNRREEKERGKNINVWLTLACPLLGTWPATQARSPDWESNQQPFGLQAGAQSI